MTAFVGAQNVPDEGAVEGAEQQFRLQLCCAGVTVCWHSAKDTPLSLAKPF